MSETTDEAASPVGARSNIWLRLAPLAVFGALAALFVVALLRPDAPSTVPSVLIGKAAPRLTLPALAGIGGTGTAVPGIAPADLAQGQPVVVNFWQSSCAPCVGEHPLLIELRERSGVPLLGVNYKDPESGARRFLNRYGNPFSAVGVDGDGRAAIEWGVYGMPETFVLDGTGRVVLKHIGAITPEVLDRVLLPAIAKARQGAG